MAVFAATYPQDRGITEAGPRLGEAALLCTGKMKSVGIERKRKLRIIFHEDRDAALLRAPHNF
jgi:hypothetical protein